MGLPLSKMVQFSIQNHCWKALNEPYPLKAWSVLLRANALIGDYVVYPNIRVKQKRK